MSRREEEGVAGGGVASELLPIRPSDSSREPNSVCHPGSNQVNIFAQIGSLQSAKTSEISLRLFGIKWQQTARSRADGVNHSPLYHQEMLPE